MTSVQNPKWIHKVAYCDGASNSYKKRSGIGVVFFDYSALENIGDGKTLSRDAVAEHAISKEIFSDEGSDCIPTNNEAEYKSLISALEFAVKENYNELTIFMDSKLVVEQVNERWKINYPHLKKLKDKVMEFKEHIKFNVIHVKREYNSLADRQSKNCIE